MQGKPLQSRVQRPAPQGCNQTQRNEQDHDPEESQTERVRGERIDPVPSNGVRECGGEAASGARRPGPQQKAARRKTQLGVRPVASRVGLQTRGHCQHESRSTGQGQPKEAL